MVSSSRATLEPPPFMPNSVKAVTLVLYKLKEIHFQLANVLNV